MKLTKFTTAILLVMFVAFAGCKSKSAKELIVNKWKITDVSGDGAKEMSETEKGKLKDSTTMEFTKDGKCTITGMRETPTTGTYSVSDDGKTITMKQDGESKDEQNELSDVSASKMTINFLKDKLKISFAVK